MKSNIIKYACVALVASAAVLTSCSDDEAYDFPGIANSRIYFSNASSIEQGSLVKTPIGYVYSMEPSFNILSTSPTKGQTSATIAIDNSLVEAYNLSHGTQYATAPEGSVSLKETTLTIDADTTASKSQVELVVPENSYELFKAGETYLIPVKVVSTDAGYQPSSNVGQCYFSIKVEAGSIKKNPAESDLKGTNQTDQKSWMCISATGLNANEFQNLYSGGWSRYWYMSETKAGFVIDLQKEKNVTAVGIGNSILKTASISVSKDNKEWIDMGSVQASEMLFIDYQTRAAVFYAPSPCRYLKVNFQLDESNRYVERYKYLADFRVYAE